MGYYGDVKINAKRFAGSLRNGYVWFDFLSIPQANKEAQGRAIQSIVAYISNSSFFMCLAGDTGGWLHADNRTPRDRHAWGGRGWCRMEVLANALSPQSKPIILARALNRIDLHPPTGIHCNSFLLATVGSGAFTVDADRIALGEVIEALITPRAKFAWATGDVIFFRILMAGSPKLLERTGRSPEPLPFDAWMRSMRFSEGHTVGFHDDWGVSSGWTPLRFAVLAGRVDIAKRLLEEPSVLSKYGLVEASAPGYKLDIEAPLKKASEVVDSAAMSTILMLACMTDHDGSMVRLLLSNGADATRADAGASHSAIHYAGKGGATGAMDVLIEMHLKEDAQRRKEGKPEVFGYASVMGGDINTIPAFCCLVEYGRLECFEHVLNKWPEVMKEQLLFESAAGRTTQQEQAKHSKPLKHLPPSLSLHAAGAPIINWVNMVAGHVPTLRAMIDAGKSFGVNNFLNRPNPCTDSGFLKLMKVMNLLGPCFGWPYMFYYLTFAYPGASPLNCAVAAGNIGCVELLIAEGADVNECSSHPNKRGPLHAAAAGGDENICSRLVDAKADLSQKCSQGRMAEDWANATGHKELAATLRGWRDGSVPRRPTEERRRLWRQSTASARRLLPAEPAMYTQESMGAPREEEGDGDGDGDDESFTMT